MRNKKVILVVTTLVLVATLATVAILYFAKDTPAPVDPTPNNTSEKVDDYLIKDGVDLDLNTKAGEIELEAGKILETDPKEASKKYKEAATAYEKAGNEGKAADMSDNAMMAETMVPIPPPKEGETVITPADPQ